jgi:hypothetical protein
VVECEDCVQGQRLVVSADARGGPRR